MCSEISRGRRCDIRGPLIEEEGRGKSEDVASKSRCVVGASKPVAMPVEERVLQGTMHEFRYGDGGHFEFLYGYLRVIRAKFDGFCLVSQEKVETVGRHGARTLEVACQILWCELGGGGNEFSDARVRGRVAVSYTHLTLPTNREV